MASIKCTNCGEEIAEYSCRKCNDSFIGSRCVMENTIDISTFTCICYEHFCRCDSEDPEYCCTSCGIRVCFECTTPFSINKETMECLCIYHLNYNPCFYSE